MEIEVIETVEGYWRLWDGGCFLADCGKGPEGKERAKTLQSEFQRLRLTNDDLNGLSDRAEAEAAVLRGALQYLVGSLNAPVDRRGVLQNTPEALREAEQVLASNECGAALLSRLRTTERERDEQQQSAIYLTSKLAEVDTERLSFKHKAEQYDDVVAAVQAVDGGRYRNDTIEALLARLSTLATLRAELDEANEVIAYLKGQEPIAELQAAVRHLRAADAQLHTLRTALEPFARYAREVLHTVAARDEAIIDSRVLFTINDVAIRYGDLRRAAEVLE